MNAGEAPVIFMRASAKKSETHEELDKAEMNRRSTRHISSWTVE